MLKFKDPALGFTLIVDQPARQGRHACPAHRRFTAVHHIGWVSRS
jgi:hypothetical protein